MTQTPEQQAFQGVQSLGTRIENDVAWLRTHFVYAVLFVAIVLGSIYGAVRLVNGIITAHDEKKDQQLSQVLANSKANDAALLARLDQDKQANDARDQQVNALLGTLIAQMNAQREATRVQVQKDSTLSTQDAAARLVQQEKAQPGQVTTSADKVIVDTPLTRQIVADLDKYAQAQKDVDNLNGQLDAQKTLTQDAKQNFENAQKVISADKDTLIAQIKADVADCKVQVDKERDKGNKRTLWASIAGFVAGIILHK